VRTQNATRTLPLPPITVPESDSQRYSPEANTATLTLWNSMTAEAAGGVVLAGHEACCGDLIDL
jgi:hypothetical protein